MANRIDILSQSHIANIESHLRALVGPSASIRTQVHPRTGGLATRVTIGSRTAWLSCTRDEILRYVAYDGEGRPLPPLPSTGTFSNWRLATQAQVVALYVRGQSLRRHGAPDPYVIKATNAHWSEARPQTISTKYGRPQKTPGKPKTRRPLE